MSFDGLYKWADKNKIPHVMAVGIKPNVKGLNRNEEELKEMKEIYLYGFNITDLPSDISCLNHIEKLCIHDNELKTLPKEIGDLSNLKTLIISSNNFNSLPDEITKLTTLSELLYDENAESIFNEKQKKWIKDLEKSGCEIAKRSTL